MFCSSDAIRPALMEPFSLGPHTYATDGRVIIRVPVIAGVKTENIGADKLEWNLPAGGTVCAIPEIQPPEMLACPDCKGTGKMKLCARCNGKGWTRCFECGHETECRTCRGKTANNPDTPCCECDGAGRYEAFGQTVEIGGSLFGAQYLRKIVTLPGLVFYVGTDATQPAYFTFDGGEGIIMPISKL